MITFNFTDSSEVIQVMDVGAAAIAEVPIYKNLLDMRIGKLIAFEGDDRQIESIKKEYGEAVSIYKEFLFDGTAQTLYLASGPSGMSSLLKPKIEALKFFNGFEQFGKVECIEQVNTTRLDDIQDLPLIDFLKMDIQGAELTVLKNGIKKLKNCIAVQLEVSYICLYENQPTFGEVDVWMRTQGFVPHCFLDVKRWSITPTIFNNNFRVSGNQLLESDIVYVKDPLALKLLSETQLKKYAAIAHHCLKSYDLCVFILLELEMRMILKENTYVQYLDSLQNIEIIGASAPTRRLQ
jgi:FkbM family methyltransferase